MVRAEPLRLEPPVNRPLAERLVVPGRFPERREALRRWEEHLATILGRGEPAAPAEAITNVVAMPKRRVRK